MLLCLHSATIPHSWLKAFPHVLEHTTVLSLQGSLLLVLSGVILFALRGRRQDGGDTGSPWLAAAYFCCGLGLEMLSMEATLPAPLRTVVGNTLLLLFNPLAARGLARATGQRTRMDWYLFVFTLVTVANFSYFTYRDPRWLLLSWEAGFVTAVLYGALIWLLWQSKEHRVWPAVRAMIAFLVLHIVANTIRLIAWRYMHTTLWFSGMNVISSLGIALSYLWMDTLRMQAYLEQTAMTDALTGLYNRRALDMLANRELQRVSRTGMPCSALMIDVDHFKEINDTLGHAAGDTALRAVADALRAAVRASDIATRMGGDEFFTVLPDADENGVQRIILRIQQALAGMPLQSPKGEAYCITASMGYATLRGTDITVADLMHASDQVLYRAKQTSRAALTNRSGLK